MYRLIFLVFALVTCIPSLILRAQEETDVRDSLFSEILHEQRLIYIRLPANYSPDSEKEWDVIYVTDGEWTTSSTSYIYEFARNENFLPHSIIVGIANVFPEGENQRDRDFLPVHMEDFPLSGKADQFLNFLEKELIPFVNEKYHGRGERTLIGHSFGGIFAVYALLTEPDLFENYIATDPPLQWNNYFMNKLASEKLSSLAGANKSLWISGIESTAKWMGNISMDSVLQAIAPAGLHWKIVNYPNETHNSVRHKGVYDGLKFAYDGYISGRIEFHPMNGIILKEKPFNVKIYDDPAGIFYATDGSQPTLASAKMEKEISLIGPLRIQLKNINKRGKWDISVNGEFVEGRVLKAIKKPKRAVSGGFSYSYFEGPWDTLPNFKNLRPVKTGIFTKDFALSNIPGQNPSAYLVEGFLEVEEDGYYVFGLSSEKSSKFYLGDQLLIKSEGLPENFKMESFLVPLQKGFYPIRLEYLQISPDRPIQVYYVTPDDPYQAPVNIPRERQYRLK